MTTTDLSGRDDELRVLTELVQRAPERGGAIVVLGEAGIGKSSLARAAADRARTAGFRISGPPPRDGPRSTVCMSCSSSCSPKGTS